MLDRRGCLRSDVWWSERDDFYHVCPNSLPHGDRAGAFIVTQAVTKETPQWRHLGETCMTAPTPCINTPRKSPEKSHRRHCTIRHVTASPSLAVVSEPYVFLIVITLHEVILWYRVVFFSYSLTNKPAIPMPVPTHMLTTPTSPPDRPRPCNRVLVMRAPVAPRG